MLITDQYQLFIKKKKKYVIKYVKKNYGFENQIFLTAKKIHVEKINLFESVK